LLEIIAIKRYCREAGIEKLEAGPKGAVISLRDNRFVNPAGLVDLIQRNAGTLKLRPDHKILYQRNWDDAKARLTGVAKLVQALAKIARTAKPEAAPPLSRPTRHPRNQKWHGGRDSAGDHRSTRRPRCWNP
jgi:transcription-repair coupling factor (superfamily II helicase)